MQITQFTHYIESVEYYFKDLSLLVQYFRCVIADKGNRLATLASLCQSNKTHRVPAMKTNEEKKTKSLNERP